MVESALDDGVATVRLASPATANALSPAAYAELTAAVARWQQPDSGARVLVLTGQGRVFSAGADLDLLGVTDAAALERQIVDALAPLQRVLHEGRLPAIAAVNGAAVGGAVGLALWCDVVVAAASASFSLPFAKLGLIADTGLTSILPRLVGEARARAWMMGGADIGAREAAAIGMIHACFEDADFEYSVRTLAARYARLPGASFALLRQVLVAGRTNGLPEQLALEAHVQAGRVTSDEFRAAAAAFAARRKR